MLESSSATTPFSLETARLVIQKLGLTPQEEIERLNKEIDLHHIRQGIQIDFRDALITLVETEERK